MRESLTKKMLAKGFITVKQAAEQEGIPPSTLYDWLGRGCILGRRVGTARFVSVASLSEHLQPSTRKR